MRGWAGLYAVNTLDANAIIGEWPELMGFYLAMLPAIPVHSS